VKQRGARLTEKEETMKHIDEHKTSDCKAHALELFQTTDGAWGVLLDDYVPDDTDNWATATFFATEAEALAFVAEHAPRQA
jgi:hypothetical protein